MGYIGRLADKLQAQQLRRQGLSYKEIIQKINVSKGTISDWCKDITLTSDQELRLLNNVSLGQRKGSLVAAENKRKMRKERTETAYRQAKKELGNLSKRDRFVVGIALYAGEGDKTDRHGGFANSDPKLITFMMTWFREFCQLPLEKFRGSIWLHEGLSEEIAKKYWSVLTGIPVSQFQKTYIAINKKDSKKIRKNIHEYGVFSIKFSDASSHRRIMGLISASFDDKISNTSAIL